MVWYVQRFSIQSYVSVSKLSLLSRDLSTVINCIAKEFTCVQKGVEGLGTRLGMLNLFCLCFDKEKLLGHSDCDLPLPAPQGGQERSSTPEASFRGHQPPGPSRSGEGASTLPHGFGSCLCFGTEGLTCTIEMILVSTVLTCGGLRAVYKATTVRNTCGFCG